jgi:hypothetical protein
MSPVRLIRKKIGELLIERGVITEQHLESALQEQRMKGGYISQYLISMGFATEIDIASCLSSQYGFAYMPLENYVIPSTVLEIIPLKLIKIYSILPIDKMGNVLTIVMADPLNDGVIEMLKQITSYDIRVFISTYSDLSRAIERYFGPQLKKQIDAYGLDAEDEMRQDIALQFIQTKSYSGIEHRRYARIDVDQDMVYFLGGNSYKAKVKNLSYLGIYFAGPSFIPVDTNIYANIVARVHLEDAIIYTIIQVVRVENLKENQGMDSSGNSAWNYGIAGFFSFISKEDKEKLKVFLKEQFQKVKQGK